MKVTFIGGGSFRTLPILRGALATPEILTGGEIVISDLNVSRAEAVGRMIMKTPEYAAVGCKVTWDAPIEAALDGADAVSIGFPCGEPVANWRSSQASRQCGFMSSDQLSPAGSFMGLYGGPIVLDYARKMEQYCPQAWYMIFANPVAVYSALVNNYTRIRALGICAGYYNHIWDISRLLGKDETRDDIDVDVAGVNHLSFILRGTVGSEDLYEVLGRSIGKGWRPPKLQKRWQHMEKHIYRALRKLIDQYEKFGYMMFSTEGDGLTHLYYGEFEQRNDPNAPIGSVAKVKAQAQRRRLAREAADQQFRAHLDQDLAEKFWRNETRAGTHFGRDDHHITVKILRGLAGLGTQKIATCHPNRGAVVGFNDRTVLEYSQFLDQDGLRAVPNLEVPAPHQGLISALATHQTLLADAIATEDPQTLYHALYAYPIKQNTENSRKLYTELLKINKELIPAAFQETKRYFKEK